MKKTRPLYYLSYSLIPSREANGIHVMRMCEALADVAQEVVLFCRRQKSTANSYEHYGVRPIFRIQSLSLPRIPVLTRLLYSLISLWRLRQAPQNSIVFGRDVYLIGLLAVTPFFKRTFSLEVHQPPGGRFETFLQRRVFTSTRFHRLVVISQALEQEYRRRFGSLLDGRIVLARDAAVDMHADTPGPEADEPAANGKFRLGYVGSLSVGKGLGFLGRLAARLPTCRFEIFGGSPAEVTEWKSRIKSENVVFHGFVSPENAARCLRSFDVALAPYQPTVRVGHKQVDVAPWMSPLKIFEYMAAEKPLIASDLPVLKEFLEDGKCALLAPPDDVEAWARHIEQLRRDPQTRQQLGANARAQFVRFHTWKQRAAAVYHALAAPSSP